MRSDKNRFLFQYNPQNTCIHRLPVGIKFCVLCLSSFALYGASQPLLAVYTGYSVLVCIAARISLATVKKNCRFLCIYAVGIFLIKIIGLPLTIDILTSIAAETAFFMQRFALILFTASVFYETTSKLELFTFCEGIERSICRGRYTGSFSTVFTLTLMCVPRVFELWAQLNYAYDARTDRRKNIGNAYRRIAFLLPALIENLLRFALTAEKALKNRTVMGNGEL